MPPELPDWPRQYFEESGGNPFLFYVVFGRFGELPAMSASKYRSKGVFPGLDLSHHDQPDVLNGFREGYLWEDLKIRNPDLWTRTAEAKECLILRGELEDSETLNYFRETVGLLTFLLDQGGICIYDPFMLEWWTPEKWHKQVFEPAGPVPLRHVIILASHEPEPSLTWFHTRGMRKFGRPDLSVHNVPKQHHEAVTELCERFIQFQALGGIIEEGKVVKMNNLPEGMICRHAGDLDDPDFNNVHVEISFAQERN